jgi:arsenate reductase-like glutaredoxin family protein
VEEFLSQNSIPYQLRNQFVDPVTPDEVFALFHDQDGRQIGPLTKVGNYVDPENGPGLVYGCDLLRLDERFEIRPGAREDGAVVYGRQSDHGKQLILDYCRSRSIPVELVDIDQEPLSRDELWDLLFMPGSGIIQSPLTVVDDQVVLGYDLEWLKGAMGPAAAGLKDVPAPRAVSKRVRAQPTSSRRD